MNSNAATEVADHNSKPHTSNSHSISTDSSAMSSPHLPASHSSQNYTPEDPGNYTPSSSHVTNSESEGGTVTSSAGGYGNGPSAATEGGGEFKSVPQGQPKRLHVSNIPFRFREPDLRQLFYVSSCE